MMKRAALVSSVMACGVCLCHFAAASEPDAWYAILEAEDLRVKSGWEVIRGREGYFPAHPNLWSGNRLRADRDCADALAEQKVEVPATGRYALWVRYESSFGFDSRFRVEIRQRRKTVFSGEFGDRDDRKYFNGVWRVQEGWRYHNTDYVYQNAVAELGRGPGVVVLKTGAGGEFGAARIVDLICLTSDLNMKPGREMMGWRERNSRIFFQPPIRVRCITPVYFRLQGDKGSAEPLQVKMHYRLWCTAGGKGFGPNRNYFFTLGGLRQHWPWVRRKTIGDDERLPAGSDSGWRRLDMNRWGPALLTVTASGPARLSISHSANGRGAEAFVIGADLTRQLIVATGNSRLEQDMVQGKPAVSLSGVLQRYIKDLDAYQVPGKRAFKFGVLGPFRPGWYDGFDNRQLSRAVGFSGQYFACSPSLYGPDADDLGIDRSMGYRASMPQSAALKRDCYEGNYARLRRTYEGWKARFTEQGIGGLPHNVKMIEERGPPRLSALRTWPKINERFREYVRQQELRPAELLDRKTLTEAVLAGKTGDEDLWPLVKLSIGTPAAAQENPLLFYHTKYFGSLLFADNCANAVKLLEEILPKGSLANSGAVMLQDGHGVRHNWYDEFMLFRRRGMTAFGSEMTWGQCGMPYYVGPQSESYQGAIARAVAKYHNAVLGPSHLLVSGLYGYNGEYVETASYALASHGFRSLAYYDSSQNQTFHVYRDIRFVMKRVSWTLGAVEDALTECRVVPSPVALGWSETTSIWDQAVPPTPGFNMPGNVMYQLERHYLYLLLRHLQLPVDVVCDADIEEGRLQDYELYFQVGDHITGKAATALRKWTEEGGVLVSVAGGGMWDEYNRPLDTLKEVYGVKGGRQYAEERGTVYIPGLLYEESARDNRLEKREQALRAKLELIHAHPMDRIRVEGYEGKLPVLGYRQTLAPVDGTVVGRFADGKAAVVKNDCGKGKALIMGFLPGIANLYRAFPRLPYGRGGEDLSLHLYPECGPLVRGGLPHLLDQVWPERGATVTCSVPHVEANLLKQRTGAYHVALVNYSATPVRDLEVRIRSQEVGNAREAKAAFAKVKTAMNDSVLTVTLPLRKFDWLTLE